MVEEIHIVLLTSCLVPLSHYKAWAVSVTEFCPLGLDTL